MKKLFILGLFLFTCFSLQAKQINVVCAGNSLTKGIGTHTATFPYPDQLQRLLGSRYHVVNTAVSGQATTDIITNYTTQVGNYYDASTYDANILVLLEGRNDLVTNSATVGTAFNNLKSVCNTARAQGWTVIIVTITPSWSASYKGSSTVTGYNNLDTDRLALNAALRKGWALFADAIVDFGANSLMGTFHQNEQAGYTYSSATRPTPNAFYDDGTHYTDNGYGLLAEAVRNQITHIA